MKKQEEIRYMNAGVVSFTAGLLRGAIAGMSKIFFPSLPGLKNSGIVQANNARMPVNCAAVSSVPRAVPPTDWPVKCQMAVRKFLSGIRADARSPNQLTTTTTPPSIY